VFAMSSACTALRGATMALKGMASIKVALLPATSTQVHTWGCSALEPGMQTPRACTTHTTRSASARSVSC
jgi:hypothetical protein